MSNQLISREALKNVILNDRKLDGVNANWEVNRILVHIDNAPTVEPKQGEWIMESKLYGGFGDSVLAITCSICKESFVYRGTTHNFCPNCGAEMKQEEEL